MSNHEVAIGEFSRLTYLSVKTLRHYHDVGLLEPASVDRHTGYRRYSLEQVAQAHLIRRLRDLDMPVPEVREVLAAPDDAARDARLRAHLEHMEAQLERTRSVVASLRELLSAAGAPLEVTYRRLEPQPVLAVRDLVTAAGSGAWYDDAVAALTSTLSALGVTAEGPFGCTWAREFFEDERGEAVAFVPVPLGIGAPAGGVLSTRLPGGLFAVAPHLGGFEDFDRTYGALGSHVVRHDTPLPDPVREIYLVGPGDTADSSAWRTDVLWPIAA